MNNLTNYFDAQYFGYFWLIVAVIFLFAEVVTPGLFFFIAFAIGAICASFFAFLSYSFMTQCVIALISSSISFLFFRYYFKKREHKRIKSNVDALIGQQALVIRDITNEKFGQVKIKGEIWAADIDVKEEKAILTEGIKVEVVKVIGNRLIVKSFETPILR